MAQERIPFIPAEEQSASELAGAGREAFNVVVDGRGCVRRRPGIAAYGTGAVIDPDGLSGVHVTSNNEIFVVGASSGTRSVYRVTEGGHVDLPDRVTGGLVPTFAETQRILAIAAGRDILRVDLNDYSATNLGGNPPKSTHVIAHAARLLCLNSGQADSKNRISYSSVQNGDSYAGHELWNGDGGSDSGFFEANARPDPNRALWENTNEVFVFGRSNLQVFTTDPRFRYVPSATRDWGISAPYSVIKSDQSFGWLDDKRRFVFSDAREFEPIGLAMKGEIDDMENVEDCVGYRLSLGQVDVLCWAFPSAGRTLTYQSGVGWGRWASWDEDGANWKTFPVRGLARLANGTHLVALANGQLGQMSFSTPTDLGDKINASITTGFIDHNTGNIKDCTEVQLIIRRGQLAPSQEPIGWLEWRDDLGVFRRSAPVRFGSTSDRETVVRFYSLGTYRQRQWRFVFSHAAHDFQLAAVHETFEVVP